MAGKKKARYGEGVRSFVHCRLRRRNMSKNRFALSIPSKTVLLGAGLVAAVLLAAGLASWRAVKDTQRASVHDMASTTLESLLVELQSNHLDALNLKEQLSRQRRVDLKDALETVTAFLRSEPADASRQDVLRKTGRFINQSLDRQGLRVFILDAETVLPLFASENTPLPENILELLDESGNPVALNFQRSFQYDRQEYAWRAIFWSENNTHLACATLYPPLQAMIVASMSLDDIRIAFELRQNRLRNSLSRVFNTGAMGSAYTFCINSTGDVLSHPFLEGGENLFSHLPPGAASRLLQQHRDEAASRTLQLRMSVAPDVGDAADRELYIFYRYYPPLDWFLVYAAPRESYGQFAASMSRTVILTGGLLLLFAVLVLYVFGKSLSTPLRQMQQVAQQRREGDLGSACDENALAALGSRQDELGELARDCAAMCRRMDERERALRDELELVLEQAWAPPYSRVNPQLQLVRCNSAFAGLCGVQRQDIEGRSLASLPCSEFASEMLARDRSMLKTRIPMRFELQLPGQDQAPARQLQMQKLRLDEDVVTFMTDMTSQRQLLREGIQALRQAVVGGMASQLFRELALFLEQADGAEAATRPLADELKRLLRAAGELATGGAPNDCELPGSLTAAVGLLQNTLLQAGVTVNVHCNPAVTRLGCSCHDLKLALCCLLLNALEALAHSDAQPKFVIVDLFPELRDGREHVALRVEDNGPGIALDILPHVRQPFFTTRQQRGALGLGLHYCDQLAQSLGGWLEVFCPPNRGALITLVLPERKP